MTCESGTAGKSPGSRYRDSTGSRLGAVIRPARDEGPLWAALPITLTPPLQLCKGHYLRTAAAQTARPGQLS